MTKTKTTTQNKQKDSQKKRKNRLLAIWIPVGVVALAGATTGIVLGVKSCSKTNTALEVIYVTNDAKLGTYTVDGELHQQVIITFKPEDKYMLDSSTVKVTVGNEKLIWGTHFFIVGNSIVIKAKYVTANRILIEGSAKLEPSVDQVTGITAIGFEDKAKGSTFSASDISVIATYESGETKVLDYSKSEYKVYLHYYGDTPEGVDKGLVNIATPITLSDVGSYVFAIKHADNETIVCSGTINVFENKQVDVDYTTLVTNPSITFPTIQEKVSISNNTITFKSQLASAASVEEAVVKFKVYSGSDTTVQSSLLTTTLWTKITKDSATEIKIKLTSWSQITDKVYIAVEAVTPIDVACEQKSEVVKYDLTTDTVDPVNNTITVKITSADGSTPLYGYINVWRTTDPKSESAKIELITQSTPKIVPAEGKDAGYTFNVTIPDTFSWNFGAGESIYVEFVSTKTAKVEIDPTSTTGMTISVNTGYEQVTDIDGTYRTTEISASNASEKTGYFYLGYADDEGNVYQVSSLKEVTLNSTPQNISLTLSDWAQIPSNKVSEVNVCFATSADIAVTTETSGLPDLGIDFGSGFTQTINFAQPKITMPVTWTTSPTKHIDLVVTDKDKGTVVGIIKNVDLSSTTSPSHVEVEVTNFAAIGTSKTVVVSAVETTKQIKFVAHSSMAPYFNLLFKDNNPIIEREGSDTQFTMPLYYQNVSSQFTMKGKFHLQCRALGKAWQSDAASVEPKVTYPLSFAQTWDQFGYENEVEVRFIPDAEYKQIGLYVSGVAPTGIHISSHDTIVDTETKKVKFKVKNTDTKTWSSSVYLTTWDAKWELTYSENILAGEEKEFEIDLSESKYDTFWATLQHTGYAGLYLYH